MLAEIVGTIVLHVLQGLLELGLAALLQAHPMLGNRFSGLARVPEQVERTQVSARVSFRSPRPKLPDVEIVIRISGATCLAGENVCWLTDNLR